MIRMLKIFSLALLAMFGLIACTSTTDTAEVESVEQAAVSTDAQTRPASTPFPTPAGPTIEAGRPAFLISYADW